MVVYKNKRKKVYDVSNNFQGGKEVTKMELDRWIGSYKVRSFPWIDGKRIYFNVQYQAPGQSIEKPPVLDKTVYVTDNEEGRRLVYELTDSLVNHIACMEVKQNG